MFLAHMLVLNFIFRNWMPTQSGKFKDFLKDCKCSMLCVNCHSLQLWNLSHFLQQRIQLILISCSTLVMLLKNFNFETSPGGCCGSFFNEFAEIFVSTEFGDAFFFQGGYRYDVTSSKIFQDLTRNSSRE